MGKCRKRGHPSGWIRRSKRLRIYARDEFRCVYCNCQYPRLGLTLDHVRARSNGGHNHHTNLVTACRSCNSSKQNRTLREWITCRNRDRNRLSMTEIDLADIRRRVRNAQRRVLP